MKACFACFCAAGAAGAGRARRRLVAYQDGKALQLAMTAILWLGQDGLVHFVNQERFDKVQYEKSYKLKFNIRRSVGYADCGKYQYVFVSSDYFDRNNKHLFSTMFPVPRHCLEMAARVSGIGRRRHDEGDLRSRRGRQALSFRVNMNQTLLIELLTEELPPKALEKLAASFAQTIGDELKKMQFAPADAEATIYASPRRLAVQLANVAALQPDQRSPARARRWPPA